MQKQFSSHVGSSFGKENKLAKQLVNQALLANGMLKGEDLDKFVNAVSS